MSNYFPNTEQALIPLMILYLILSMLLPMVFPVPNQTPPINDLYQAFGITPPGTGPPQSSGANSPNNSTNIANQRAQALGCGAEILGGAAAGNGKYRTNQ